MSTAHLFKDNIEASQIENIVRDCGVDIIRGGNNSIRLTPYFLINSEEIEFIVSRLRYAFNTFLDLQKN